MIKKIFFLFILLIITYSIFHVKNELVVMKYFPKDVNTHFVENKTTIELNKQNKGNELTFSVYSQSSDKAYLRQDISLLYENGLYKAMLQSWEENTDTISLSKTFTLQHDAVLDAISFHHGEIHYDDTEAIFSIQKMTRDTVYVPFNNGKPLLFSEPSTDVEKTFMQTLNRQTYEKLLSEWDELIRYFDMGKDNYHIIPLTNMEQFETVNIPNKSKTATEKIIGQFWEGLYSEYITLLLNNTNDMAAHYMPIVLLKKDNTQIDILFCFNDQKYRLIQEL